MNTIQNEKKKKRDEALKLSQQLQDPETDQKIIERLLDSDLYKNAESLFVTVSFRSEIPTFGFIKRALQDGKQVYIPKTIPEKKMLIPVRIRNFPADLEESVYGILEPKYYDDVKFKKDFDLIIVPGLMFNELGERLGYGGGYYDRFLEDNPSETVALSREGQVVESIVTEPHDIKVKHIITEDRHIVV